MDPHVPSPAPTVSNLVPSWDDRVDGGGSFTPAAAAAVVEQAVHAELPRRRPRLVTPPRRFDGTERAAGRPSYAYDLLAEAADSWNDEEAAAPVAVADAPLVHDADGLPLPEYDALRRRDIARELLRARLVALAEQREHRSAYEIAFVLLAAAVAVLLAAPPLVQVLLAAHGIQA